MEQIVKYIVNDLRFNLILVQCYEPHEECYKEMLHFGREELLEVMEWAAVRMIGLASRYGLALVDLSRTLNPFEREHYGKKPYKPSNQSSEFIADLISYVLDNHDFKAFQDARSKKEFDFSTLSKIYYGKKGDRNGIQVESITSQSRMAWSKDLHAIAPGISAPSDMDLLADLFGEETVETRPANKSADNTSSTTSQGKNKSGQKEEEESKVPLKDRPRR